MLNREARDVQPERKSRFRLHVSPAMWSVLPVWTFLLGAIAATTTIVLSPSAGVDLGIAAVVAAWSVALGCLPQWRAAGHVDLMGPTAFPLLYVAVSTLAPAWMILVHGQALMGFRPELYGTRSASLLGLSVVAFSVGVQLWARKQPVPSGARRLNRPELSVSASRNLHLLGRGLVLLLILVAAATVLNGGVRSRALAQSTYQVTDSINAAALIAAVPAVILIMTTRAASSSGPALDVGLIAALIGFSAASGGRTTSLEILVTVTFFLTRHRNSTRRAVIGVGVMLLFSVAVLIYRQHEMGSEGSSALTSVATDLSPVSYTVGLVDARVPSTVDYQYGATYADALLHQLPSVLTQPLFGAATHSGSQLFRHQILQQTDANSGYGFSLPAEAYLNFGSPGVIVVPLILGLLVAWTYRWVDARSVRPSACAYIVTIATLPLAYRSDSLGAIKGVLYPLIFFWLLGALLRRRADHEPTGPVPPA